MSLTVADADVLEEWWIQKSRVNFLAYRRFMRVNDFLFNWFITDLAKHLQQFYVDYVAGKRPVLLIQSPPQMGKSWTISDFISWVHGQDSNVKSIFATYSEKLGTRCNLSQQRFMDSIKYKKIFPNTRLPNKKIKAVRTTTQLEFVNSKGKCTGGQFRNTTVAGPVTGESLDIGIIDDAVKGREQANSSLWSQKVWDWFTDDYLTRFSDQAGLIVIMTRWTTHDIIGRLLKLKNNFSDCVTKVNYKAIATTDEEHRKTGEPLFPELKSLKFIKSRKVAMTDQNFESIYQGNPVLNSGNKFKDEWWRWWEVLPPLSFKFIVADTAQKTKKQNDWTVFQCWGYGTDDNIYLLDKLRERLEAPDLRREAAAFYNKHDNKRIDGSDAILRGIYIEDKSSGVGLIQELEREQMRVFQVPRHSDKIFRSEDVSPYVKSGRVYLNTDVVDVGNLTKESREFPNGEFDDDMDTMMSAVEVALIQGLNRPMIGVI
jgi:predicted phage terminase large subunit-like protein